MKKFLLLLLIGASFTFTAKAQMICAFDTKMEELKKENPEYARQLQETERYIRNFIATHPENARKPMATYTIPVVVHVMHTGGAVGTVYNPSDVQINGAIEYLNQIYAGTYPGMEEPEEGGGVVNMELKFVLAKRTPGCGYTSGIERVDASGIPNYAANGVNSKNTDGVSDLTLKNYSRWNPADYYNIWLVNKIDGKDGTAGQFTAGYAYFAGASASVDGTVMLATQMKSGQKTLPHEIGHAFNLHHTFNGSNLNTACATNGDCTLEGDGVCDTDPVSNNVNSSGIYDFSCRTGANSCASGNPFTRNTEKNYMAYTSCHTLFTQGQKARVQAAMTLPGRASLFASPGATSCGTGINFSVATDAKMEDKTGITSDCRTYKDYNYQLVIGEAPDAPATVTLTYSGTATKGLDYDVTTNGSFSSPANVFSFDAGSTESQTFTIRVYDDASVESAETAILNFSINTSGNATTGTRNPTFTLTIKDNDETPMVANTNTYQVGGLTAYISKIFDAANIKQRGQFLYKASELLAAGITKGPITSLQLYIYTKNTTGNFNAFTVKLGSGTSDYLSEGTSTDFITVYNNAALSTTLGWNSFNFSTPYVWDGISSLVVDYCYNSTTGTGIDNIGMYYDGGPSSQYNFIFKTGLDCTGQFSTFSYYGSGLKPSVKFGLNHPATEIETTASETHTEYLTTGSNDYFYSNSNKIIAKIGNLDAEAGCVQVSVESAGTTWQPLFSGRRSEKIFAVTPAMNGSTTSYSISLYFTEAELGGKVPGTLKIAKTSASTIGEANAENTQFLTPVVTMLGTNVVFTASFTGFSRFFLAENQGPLPITLLSFKGELNDRSEADLSWKITHQRNFKGFDVERSPDAQLFTAIKNVDAIPGNAAIYEYHFTDKMVSIGLNYYRLKMIDNDGNFSYSEVVKIVNNGAGQFVTLMSNPVKEAITLSVNNNSLKPISAILYNAVGAKVAAWQLGTKTGTIQLPVEQYKLTPGVYLLQVSDGNKVETLKVVKK